MMVFGGSNNAEIGYHLDQNVKIEAFFDAQGVFLENI